MTDRGLVEVPENAVRDEPLAFGLTASQLLLCGAAVGIGALLNLVPLWLPAKLVLVLVCVGPVVLAAILPIRGEPAYRWVIRAVRFWRGARTWHAVLLPAPGKSEISEPAQDPGSAHQEGADVDTAVTRLGARDERVDAGADVAPRAQEQERMGERTVRLRVVDPDDDPGSAPDDTDQASEAPSRPAAIPHVVAGLRVIAVLSFAGGVGKTTLAVEIATLVAERARIRSMEGTEQAVRVIVLDAARIASAVGLRLGLDPAALSAAWSPRIWRDPSAIGELTKATRSGADVLTLPPHPQLAERDGLAGDLGHGVFGAAEADALLEGVQRAGYHLLVADLGGVLEDGHRQLIDQADLVLGVVRPTLESLPDVFRLATVLRSQGMGRKLGIVANGADDDTEIRRLAREADVPTLGRVGADPAFTVAADRGEPAWSMAPARVGELTGVARSAWPLLLDTHDRAPRRRSVLRAVRGAIPAPGSTP